MGPRRFRRGNCSALEGDAIGGRASMGPRRFRRGNGSGPSWILRTLGLQWGRDVSVAEIANTAGTNSASMQLQWGRDVSVAEIT